jgi:hypothetical protein
MTTCGYAQVSIGGQTLPRKFSTMVANRNSLAKALTALGVGDVPLATRLDRRQEHQGPPERVGGGWRNDRRCFAFKNPACRPAARQRSFPGTTGCSLRTPVPTRWWGHCHRFHKSSSRSMAS